jgi:hypothetical protein
LGERDKSILITKEEALREFGQIKNNFGQAEQEKIMRSCGLMSKVPLVNSPCYCVNQAGKGKVSTKSEHI